jgi:hypothetical protein
MTPVADRAVSRINICHKLAISFIASPSPARAYIFSVDFIKTAKRASGFRLRLPFNSSSVLHCCLFPVQFAAAERIIQFANAAP